jgi:hypothetical protein
MRRCGIWLVADRTSETSPSREHLMSAMEHTTAMNDAGLVDARMILKLGDLMLSEEAG